MLGRFGVKLRQVPKDVWLVYVYVIMVSYAIRTLLPPPTWYTKHQHKSHKIVLMRMAYELLGCGDRTCIC